MPILHKLQGKELILGSQSPRRRELLQGLGVPFQLRLSASDDERYPPELPYHQIPLYLAHKKAEPLLPALKPHQVLITADTIVWCKGQVLGKPANGGEAARMLGMLSGSEHAVVTGVMLATPGHSTLFGEETRVAFRALLPQEIDYYVSTSDPLDKAGAYGIQDWIGHIGIERIEGSYFNVMGLPVHRLYTELIHLLDHVG